MREKIMFNYKLCFTAMFSALISDNTCLLKLCLRINLGMSYAQRASD